MGAEVELLHLALELGIGIFMKLAHNVLGVVVLLLVATSATSLALIAASIRASAFVAASLAAFLSSTPIVRIAPAAADAAHIIKAVFSLMVLLLLLLLLTYSGDSDVLGLFCLFRGRSPRARSRLLSSGV